MKDAFRGWMERHALHYSSSRGKNVNNAARTSVIRYMSRRLKCLVVRPTFETFQPLLFRFHTIPTILLSSLIISLCLGCVRVFLIESKSSKTFSLPRAKIWNFRNWE